MIAASASGQSWMILRSWTNINPNLKESQGTNTYVVHVLSLNRTLFKEVEGNEFDLIVLQHLRRLLGPRLSYKTNLALHVRYTRVRMFVCGAGAIERLEKLCAHFLGLNQDFRQVLISDLQMWVHSRQGHRDCPNTGADVTDRLHFIPWIICKRMMPTTERKRVDCPLTMQNRKRTHDEAKSNHSTVIVLRDPMRH